MWFETGPVRKQARYLRIVRTPAQRVGRRRRTNPVRVALGLHYWHAPRMDYSALG